MHKLQNWVAKSHTIACTRQKSLDSLTWVAKARHRTKATWTKSSRLERSLFLCAQSKSSCALTTITLTVWEWFSSTMQRRTQPTMNHLKPFTRRPKSPALTSHSMTMWSALKMVSVKVYKSTWRAHRRSHCLSLRWCNQKPTIQTLGWYLRYNWNKLSGW